MRPSVKSPHVLNYGLTNCAHVIVRKAVNYPCQSVEFWTQLVKGTSPPSQSFEMEMALTPHAFNCSVSHNLSASLRTIGACADIFKENHHGALGEDGLGYLVNTPSSPIRLGEPIAGLLAYTRTGRKNLILNILPVRGAIQNEANHLLEDAHRSGRNVQMPTQGNLVHVVAERPPFSIVVNNLLSNAFNYSANSERTIIEADGELTNGYYGCARGQRPRLRYAVCWQFFGFQQVDQRRTVDGMGAGLAIGKRMVEKYGGNNKSVRHCATVLC